MVKEQLLTVLADEMISVEHIADCAIKYMSDDDVVDMLHANEILDLDARLIWS